MYLVSKTMKLQLHASARAARACWIQQVALVVAPMVPRPWALDAVEWYKLEKHTKLS
jgi:hypothetical protein